MSREFSEQIGLISGICQRLGIDYKGLADAAGIKHETMRKWAKGYQKMPDHVAVLIGHIAQQRFPGKMEDNVVRSPSAATFDLLETETLERSLMDVAQKLTKAPEQERKYLLSNLRSILDVLDDRELQPSNSKPLSRAVKTSPSSPVQPGKNP